MLNTMKGRILPRSETGKNTIPTIRPIAYSYLAAFCKLLCKLAFNSDPFCKIFQSYYFFRFTVCINWRLTRIVESTKSVVRIPDVTLRIWWLALCWYEYDDNNVGCLACRQYSGIVSQYPPTHQLFISLLFAHCATQHMSLSVSVSFTPFQINSLAFFAFSMASKVFPTVSWASSV